MPAVLVKEKISIVIEKKGLKKKYVANKLGITPETFGRKLNKPNTFSAMQIASLVEVLGVPIEALDFEVKNF
ncbi:XRE family transcriptional regulator [Listeria monocytogenes]|uniref:helix-turn-helix domain-containing protein n=1 Tax=Listeria monocytogenes TaxID=1639 RepID=UPI0007759EFF|nr:helix-turn-helix transcriptional regulator [Listeria monocytogenes]EAF5877597.1 XRE family transcriptional regulator [Listeria monocytogenes]EKZ4877777.1 helix-turn-helix transcriptional regulator [Listeria monocytogenes]KXS65777.1 hypothetical protein AWJ02_01600 [Listeria monocytogenes]KXW92932.1 hypothetical protein AWJ00_08355 [Listeria monocytogenes]